VLAEELDDIPGKLGAPVDLGRPRRDPLAREIADQVADLALLVGQGLVRHGSNIRLNRSGLLADNGNMRAQLPLVLIPVPALVLGLLVAIGLL